jgi:ADP-heptose:LPS heptosyltransferase
MVQPRILADVDPRRICVIKPSAFGCVVQSLPLIGALRRRFPTAAISWVIRDDLLDLVSGHPELAECLVYERRGGPAAFLRLLRQLQSRKFDLVIDLQGLLRSGLMTLATRAAVRIGLETSREGASLACNVVIGATSRNVPAADRYWRVAEALGVGSGTRQSTLFVPHQVREWARSLLDGLPRPIIAVHAGAMWETKRCPPELFAAVLTRARAQFGGSVMLLGTADDAPAATRVLSLLHQRRTMLMPTRRSDGPHLSLARIDSADDCANLTGATTLKQLAALLSDVDVLLCNDSGPMHLAAALETPVVGLFTCTSPLLSGPQGRRHHLLSADVPCAASYYKSCPWRGGQHLRCHRELPVDHISHALDRILACPEQPRTVTSEDRLAAVAGTIESEAWDARDLCLPGHRVRSRDRRSR